MDEDRHSKYGVMEYHAIELEHLASRLQNYSEDGGSHYVMGLILRDIKHHYDKYKTILDSFEGAGS